MILNQVNDLYYIKSLDGNLHGDSLSLNPRKS
jgi:hypothetical protein